jgi:hypothetical protein
MADAKLTALTEISVPSLTDMLYTVDDPGGTPVSNKMATQRALGLMGLIPGGRLTLTTAVPVTTSDVTAAGTLYYTPCVHPVIRVWDGTRWLIKTFAEISLALTLTSGKNYDVFVDDDAATLVLSAAWTNDTTRADALGTQDSVIVLNSDKTKLWLGTIRASGANTTEDSVLKRFVWNTYNRKARPMLAIEATDFWAYTSTTIRQANAATANKVEFVQGANDEAVTAQLVAWVSIEDNTIAEYAIAGIGLDSITAFSGLRTGAYINEGAADTNNVFMPFAALYRGNPTIGYHYLAWLEAGCTGTCNFVGDFANTQSGLTAILDM